MRELKTDLTTSNDSQSNVILFMLQNVDNIFNEGAPVKTSSETESATETPIEQFTKNDIDWLVQKGYIADTQVRTLLDILRLQENKNLGISYWPLCFFYHSE